MTASLNGWVGLFQARTRLPPNVAFGGNPLRGESEKYDGGTCTVDEILKHKVLFRRPVPRWGRGGWVDLIPVIIGGRLTRLGPFPSR